MAAAASATTSRTKDLWRNFCHAFCRCNSEKSLDIHCGASIYAIALNCKESTLVLWATRWQVEHGFLPASHRHCQ